MTRRHTCLITHVTCLEQIRHGYLHTQNARLRFAYATPVTWFLLLTNYHRSVWNKTVGVFQDCSDLVK